MSAARKRVILSPLHPGSRTPEEIRAAVKAVLADGDREVEVKRADPTPGSKSEGKSTSKLLMT